MKKYKVLFPLKYNGNRYDAGAIADIDDTTAAKLVALNIVELYVAPKTTSTKK